MKDKIPHNLLSFSISDIWVIPTLESYKSATVVCPNYIVRMDFQKTTGELKCPRPTCLITSNNPSKEK